MIFKIISNFLGVNFFLTHTVLHYMCMNETTVGVMSFSFIKICPMS